jgi:1,4-alpha-glucan branching enzyme
MPQYTVGVPYGGKWTEVLNSDDKNFGGSGIVNGVLTAKKAASHGREHSITFHLPPLSVMVFEGEKPPKPKKATSKKKVER